MIDVASYLPHDKRDIDVPVDNAVAEEKTFEAGFNVMSQRLKDPWNKILKKQLNSKLIQYVRRVKTRDEANEFFLSLVVSLIYFPSTSVTIRFGGSWVRTVNTKPSGFSHYSTFCLVHGRFSESFSTTS